MGARRVIGHQRVAPAGPLNGRTSTFAVAGLRTLGREPEAASGSRASMTPSTRFAASRRIVCANR